MHFISHQNPYQTQKNCLNGTLEFEPAINCNNNNVCNVFCDFCTVLNQMGCCTNKSWNLYSWAFVTQIFQNLFPFLLMLWHCEVWVMGSIVKWTLSKCAGLCKINPKYMYWALPVVAQLGSGCIGKCCKYNIKQPGEYKPLKVYCNFCHITNCFQLFQIYCHNKLFC